MTDIKTEHLDWSSTQSHILTGNGLLNAKLLPGRDFLDPDHLPHYYLRFRKSWEIFLSWLKENKRSDMITGCWNRTIFCGGWKESSDYDTDAFNLQTPSIFVDMRIPKTLPAAIFALRGSLSACTLNELQVLSRQHCFAGFTYPESSKSGHGPIFTRYHIIDWNYHPKFPRNRPNRWRAELNSDKSSFKEYSVCVDDFGVPVYFERWARYENDSMGSKYLACRKLPPNVPFSGLDADGGKIEERAHDTGYRDAVLVVVGHHFAYVCDRELPFPEFAGASGPGGPALIDHLVTESQSIDS